MVALNVAALSYLLIFDASVPWRTITDFEKSLKLFFISKNTPMRITGGDVVPRRCVTIGSALDGRINPVEYVFLFSDDSGWDSTESFLSDMGTFFKRTYECNVFSMPGSTLEVLLFTMGMVKPETQRQEAKVVPTLSKAAIEALNPKEQAAYREQHYRQLISQVAETEIKQTLPSVILKQMTHQKNWPNQSK